MMIKFFFYLQQIGNRLMISNVNTKDSGKYSCVCVTDDQQLYVSDYELNIESVPAVDNYKRPKVEHAEVGSTVVLRCNSDKQPSTFQWSRQHGIFQPDQNQTSVRINYSGHQSTPYRF
jgi:hypothetical protein